MNKKYNVSRLKNVIRQLVKEEVESQSNTTQDPKLKFIFKGIRDFEKMFDSTDKGNDNLLDYIEDASKLGYGNSKLFPIDFIGYFYKQKQTVTDDQKKKLRTMLDNILDN